MLPWPALHAAPVSATWQSLAWSSGGCRWEVLRTSSGSPAGHPHCEPPAPASTLQSSVIPRSCSHPTAPLQSANSYLPSSPRSPLESDRISAPLGSFHSPTWNCLQKMGSKQLLRPGKVGRWGGAWSGRICRLWGQGMGWGGVGSGVGCGGGWDVRGGDGDSHTPVAP